MINILSEKINIHSSAINIKYFNAPGSVLESTTPPPFAILKFACLNISTQLSKLKSEAKFRCH